MMKAVLTPAFRSRALRVEGWCSTNILGNRDGLALDDPASLESKPKTKGTVLDGILGYHVEDHVVRIDYDRPRGDQKEAWDAIDLVGFLGQRLQVKVDFQCRDSILAAPLAIELARLLDLARQRGQRGQRGVQEQLGWFFKAPMTRGGQPEHALHRQEQALLGSSSRTTPGRRRSSRLARRGAQSCATKACTAGPRRARFCRYWPWCCAALTGAARDVAGHVYPRGRDYARPSPAVPIIVPMSGLVDGSRLVRRTDQPCWPEDALDLHRQSWHVEFALNNAGASDHLLVH